MKGIRFQQWIMITERLVIIINLNVSVIRTENRDKEWEVSKILVGESCLNDTTGYFGSQDNPKWERKSILLEVQSQSNTIGGCVFTFETPGDKILKIISVFESKCVNYVAVHGEKKSIT